MAERLSTGFADALNQTGSVKATMANSIIRLFSGSQPTSANETESGTLLMEITLNSGVFVSGSPTNGLNMGTSVNGVLSKDAGEVWSGVGLSAAGAGTTAGWFRWYANTVVTGASTTAIRIDGAIGGSSTYELQMSNTTIVEASPATINTFTYTTTLV